MTIICFPNDTVSNSLHVYSYLITLNRILLRFNSSKHLYLLLLIFYTLSHKTYLFFERTFQYRTLKLTRILFTFLRKSDHPGNGKTFSKDGCRAKKKKKELLS